MIEADIERAVKLLQSFQLPRDKQVGIKEKIMHKDERYFLHFFPIIRFDPGKNTMQRRYRKLFQEFFFVFGNFSQIRAIFTITDLFLKKIEKTKIFQIRNLFLLILLIYPEIFQKFFSEIYERRNDRYVNIIIIIV